MAVSPQAPRLSIANRWRRLSYSVWAPFYDLLAGGFARKRRRSIALAAPLSGERVLLLGAGTGLDLDFLPPGLELTAIDLTPAMIMRLRRRAHRLGLTVDTRVMDGHQLDFSDASFDLVILHLIVAVIPDPARCLREVARVLRPGGRAVILDKFVPDDRPPPLPLRLLNPLVNLLATAVTRRLGPLLAGTGLRVVHEESVGLGGLLKIVLCRKP